ncbi:MAG TPA: peptide-methionine (R)-S-oxide reductase MsrB [Burkholderiales bacterium]|jgi:peptide-methionine (R)-S-oxide reductase|nr:peptide-methionine (R)-S-oxide reductase MsrB [Burkholderiales bacterium]
MNRRTLLKALATAPLAGWSWLAHAQKKGMAMVDELQKNWKTFLPAGAAVPSAAEPVKLSKDEWRKRLSPAAYNVLREDGTERAGTSPLDREKRAGVFVCAGCDLPLFTSAMKFDSGTGWPSFFTTIPDVFTTKTDYYLIYPRTEYRCKRCDGHHGHVFKDGPPPTGLRYCNNGVALKFIPKDAKA